MFLLFAVGLYLFYEIALNRKAIRLVGQVCEEQQKVLEMFAEKLKVYEQKGR